jgi:hypothetical protein
MLSAMYRKLLLLLVLLVGCSAAAERADAPAAISVVNFEAKSAVPYPANYRTEFAHYLTVDRPDGVVRDIYISPNAVAALRQRRSLPDDTILVIEAYQAAQAADGEWLRDAQGRYIKGEPLAQVHVAHKRANWPAGDFPSGARAGNWNFGSFALADGAPFDEDLTACLNCHQATPRTDFLYSAPHLLNYVATQTTQYLFCELRRRTPCNA